MGDFSLRAGSAFALESGLVLANVAGTPIVSSGTTDTKGSWIELETAAGNTFTSSRIIISITQHGSATESRYLVDIGIGGSGSEVAIANNLLANTSLVSSGSNSFIFDFPIEIPTGTRIVARCQSSTSSAAIEMTIIRLPPSFRGESPFGNVASIGADTANTAGVTVARTTAGTFGSWVEMTASLTDGIYGFIVSSIRDAGSYSSAVGVTYEVGVGSAGNEETIFSGWITTQSNTESMWATTTPFIGVAISAGSRIAIRAAGSSANTDLDLDYVIYGVN